MRLIRSTAAAGASPRTAASTAATRIGRSAGQIEYERFEVPQAKGPTVVMLHEGLGSVSLWKDFPARLAKALGRNVIAYSRLGYGRSERLHAPRNPSYMHDEALVHLPEFLDRLAIESPILFGHSDGGSIALDGEMLDDTAAGVHVPPYRRRIGYVFQDARLFPHLDVRQNLAYGRRMNGLADDPAQPESTDPIIRMTHQLKTKAGRALYGLRKNTVEPVFGIIKHVMGFRQFSLRGLSNVTAEWSLVALAWNIKRMNVLRGA